MDEPPKLELVEPLEKPLFEVDAEAPNPVEPEVEEPVLGLP